MVIHPGTTAIYCGILTVENIGTVVKYHGIILSMVTGANVMKVQQ